MVTVDGTPLWFGRPEPDDRGAPTMSEKGRTAPTGTLSIISGNGITDAN